jgi:hypothetical protein
MLDSLDFKGKISGAHGGRRRPASMSTPGLNKTHDPVLTGLGVAGDKWLPLNLELGFHEVEECA